MCSWSYVFKSSECIIPKKKLVMNHKISQLEFDYSQGAMLKGALDGLYLFSHLLILLFMMLLIEFLILMNLVLCMRLHFSLYIIMSTWRLLLKTTFCCGGNYLHMLLHLEMSIMNFDIEYLVDSNF